MLIVLSIYGGLIWLVFFQLKLLSWNRTAHVVVGLIGLVIALVVVGLLNVKTPSGRVTIMAVVTEISPVVGGVVSDVPVVRNQRVKAGEALLEIDARSYQYAVDQATAALHIAELTRRHG
jgi:multidrug resistance efflux pump